MGIPRAALRILTLVLTYCVFAVIGLVVWPLRLLSPDAHLRLLAVLTRAWAASSCFLFGIRVRLEGERAVPQGSLIVANHVGTPDIFVLGSCFPAFYVSKSEIASWPLLSIIARMGCTIFAERTRRQQISDLVEQIRERLSKGCSVILFPEGGATDGSDVIAFKSSPFEAAVQAKSAVVPVTVLYHDGDRPSVACWYKMPFMAHIWRLLKLPRLDVTCIVHASIQGETDRRRLAEISRRQIRDAHAARTEAGGADKTAGLS